jgi:diguanylate cyclase (GGDEF)-like protein
VFGPGTPERRRAEREGMVLPLFDGRSAVGALVVVGQGALADDQLHRLAGELGPRLAAARALRDAEQRAANDPLTGLANRALFDRRVRAVRQDGLAEPATVVYADLDHFKRLNDTHGHAAGDAALRHVASIFSSHIRDRDLVARIGGEEFAIWLPGTPLSEGKAVAERIRRSVASLGWTWAGTVWPLTVSCGVAATPDHTADVSNLLPLADQALYRAKEAGRNRVEIAGVGG